LCLQLRSLHPLCTATSAGRLSFVTTSALVCAIVRPLVMLIASRYELARLHRAASCILTFVLPGIVWPHQTPKPKPRSLLPANEIVSSFASYMAVLLVFGFTCPPLAACVTLAVCVETMTWKHLIERSVRPAESSRVINDKRPMESPLNEAV
jgi:hypothetical protein